MNPNRPTWLEIDLDAITNNIYQLRKQVEQPCILMGIVKANAYGHGSVAVAQTILNAGVTRLGVATLDEAIELRQAAVEAPILVLGYTPPELANIAMEFNITLTIFDLDLARALNNAAYSFSSKSNDKHKALVHVKVNTGMNRLGIPPEQAERFLKSLANFPHLHIEGIYTHFATADEQDQSFTLEQFGRFKLMLDQLSTKALRPSIAHSSNSAATLALPQTHLDMVRTGIAIYGLHPDSSSCPLPSTYKPALTWKSRVAHINYLSAGATVSYGREYRAAAPSIIAVLPVGYADGFPRKPLHWQYVLINGKPAPIVGRVCMDQTMVDITSHSLFNNEGKNGDRRQSAIKQGDEVILIGRQGGACLTAEDAAQHTGTINYDVVSRILSRVPRIYIQNRYSNAENVQTIE